MFFFYLIIFAFGTVFGSFSSVIIHRLHSGEKGILLGRSKCPKCGHMLGLKDLFPLFSYLFSGGKCRYCKSPVSMYYPILELSLGVFFVLIAYFMIDIPLLATLYIPEMMLFEFLLFSAFLVFVYTVYDILFLEIPEMILAILIVAIFLALSVHSFFPNIYDWNMHAIGSDAPLGHVFLSIGVGAGILGSLYVIMLKGLDEKYDLMIFVGTILSLVGVKTLGNITLSDFPVYSGIIGVLSIFGFFFFQILISKGKWMGGGDLRIAIVLGLMLGYSYWHVGLMLTYLVGSIIGIVYIVYQKLIIKNKEYSGQIPFGPFLSIGLFLTLFYKEQIDQILVKYFLL